MNISRITETLFIAAHPLEEDIAALQQLNLGLIISMIFHKRPPAALEEIVPKVLWFRTFDFPLLPIPVAVLSQGVRAALPVIEAGKAVMVFCQKGRHRSVAMAASILIGQGYPAHGAMKLITERRPNADPYAWHIQRQISKFAAYWEKQQSPRGESE